MVECPKCKKKCFEVGTGKGVDRGRGFRYSLARCEEDGVFTVVFEDEYVPTVKKEKRRYIK